MKVVSMPRAKELLARDSDIEKAHETIADQFRFALMEGGQVAAAIVPSDSHPAISPLLFVFGSGDSIIVLLKKDASEHFERTGDETFLKWIEKVSPDFSVN